MKEGQFIPIVLFEERMLRSIPAISCDWWEYNPYENPFNLLPPIRPISIHGLYLLSHMGIE